DILDSDDDLTKLRKDIESTEKQIEEIKRLKTEQENHNALNLRPNSDPDKQARSQGDLARRTQDLAERMGKKDDPNAKPAEPAAKKDDQAKGGEKGGDNAAQEKPDSQQAKGDPKGGPQDPKAGGEQKPNPMGGINPDGSDKPTPKNGDPKAGEGK